MKELRFKENKLKKLKLIFFSLILIAGSIFVYKLSIYRNREIVSIIAIFGAIFFGICFFVLLIGFFRKEAIVATEEYFWDKSSLLNIGKVDWEDIESFTVLQYQYNQKFVMVNLFDYDKYYERLNPISKILASGNKKMGYDAIMISANALNISAEELCDALNDFMLELKFKNN